MTCPNCSSPVKIPERDGRYPGYKTPTTYTCGSVTSRHWSPAIITPECLNISRECAKRLGAMVAQRVSNHQQI